MLSTPVRRRLELREESLSPYAAKSRDAVRERLEEPDSLRGEFQRDRDRIIHSLSFRRLKHKTQVFIAPTSDHYVTRLTHTLEVAQIARTIARALDLNEDLAEAIALGHDLGHTPFGHVGEKLLDDLDPEGFRHAEQSLRTVEKLEKQGKGLNLTSQVRQGIVSHSKPRGDVLGDSVPKGLLLEGQICRISDAVAYLNHDLEDAFRAGALREDDLPKGPMKTLGNRHSLRIHTMVSDIVESSWAATGETSDTAPSITMSLEIRNAVNELRNFMFERVYVPSDLGEEGQAARNIVGLLYRHLHENPEQILEGYRNTDRPVVDYIAGMTDHFAMHVAEDIQPDIAAVFRMARP
ncbi:MAG TPA: deoxyguanosinetriphosphate triphosphohydrolase [Candidatus Latescibacteria bacterium]|nr:deoxyguanosinetriphosphate triphosphohydrolase [Candidatus Latescibacterota bacterium]